ncbi:MAG: pyridoxamine 5'-phosphate oxidase family protein [Lachnospiraceae bacterium]|nr:pyridoxamine 5'-phosphate oxidase family protein [Lachnospiraceae bacterium]
MFRELIRKDKQLSMEDCVRVLRSEKRGVLSVCGDDGYPYGMPMNHWYEEEDGCVYFHGGNIGHRLEALKKDSRVSFCVYDQGYRKEGEWALNVKSVIIFGRMELLEDQETIKAITRKLSYKFTQDEAYIEDEIEKHAHRTVLMKLVPEHICGKLVEES